MTSSRPHSGYRGQGSERSHEDHGMNHGNQPASILGWWRRLSISILFDSILRFWVCGLPPLETR